MGSGHKGRNQALAQGRRHRPLDLASMGSGHKGRNQLVQKFNDRERRCGVASMGSGHKGRN